MANTKLPAPETITKEEFDEVLGQYSALVNTISASKAKAATKPQRTLRELDEFRYAGALETIGGDEPLRPMNLDDVKTLVDWKLRHGKFRPTLPKLIASNDAVVAKETIQSAMKTYRTSHDVPATLAILTKLKGIGPATASLLLSVHDPRKVIFFSDEAFYWLCCGGKESPIKYNAKEYEALRDAAGELVERLSVSATDVEKVAYVLMKREQAVEASGADVKDVKTTVAKPKAANHGSASSTTKRKASAGKDASQAEATARRSKRTRALSA